MSARPDFDPVARLCELLDLPARGVGAVVRLLDEGNTVPFIARYRKEATGNLDEVQIRAIQDKKAEVEDLEARRHSILGTIDKQGKLTDALRRRIEAAKSKAALEDLYLPYKKKRKTRASAARELGLEPLAGLILAQGGQAPAGAAAGFVTEGVADVEAALAGARDIVAERVSEDAGVRAEARRALFGRGDFTVKPTKKGREGPTAFDDYHDHVEPLRRMAPHRFQAILRGEKEGMLRAKIQLEPGEVLPTVERRMGVDRRSPWAPVLSEAIADAWSRLLLPSLESELRAALKARADGAAVEVFAKNLEAILMAAPLGPAPVLGVDPGLRTGSKCAALDATGKLLAHDVLHLSKGAGAKEGAKKTFLRLFERSRPRAVAVGNGTGGRETEAFLREVLREAGHSDVPVVQVSESGASVYSASDVAREELGDVDLTVRGAVSIGRRLQDPLAELVKVDPKSLGVGQYQHDLPPAMLGKKLSEVVESCVNRVGVELNTASPSLLAHVAGIGPKIAQRVVEARDARGRFESRRQLLEVSGLGKRAFEQCAGFLRIRGAKNPLDASAVHPERYTVVKRMAKDLGLGLDEVVGKAETVRRIDICQYVDGDLGEPTLQDILHELEKPGRDPRARFEAPRFRDDVNTMEDLKEGMVLEGVVTNVVAFGAFVDIGVHQDGLVHVSQLADRFVEDPSQVAKTGDRIRVKVLGVDLARKRISLSAKGLG